MSAPPHRGSARHQRLAYLLSRIDLKARDPWDAVGAMLRDELHLTSVELAGFSLVAGLGVLGFTYGSGVRTGLDRASSQSPILDSYAENLPARDAWTRRHDRLRALQTEDAGNRHTVLLCDEAQSFAWLECRRELACEGFSVSDVLAIGEVTGSLTDWLQADQQLRRAPLMQAALDAAMELMDTPVVLATRTGHPVLLNPLAQSAWDTDESFRQAVRRAARGGPSGFRVGVVGGTEAPTHFLLVEQSSGNPAARRLQQAARGWRLTPRETEVLGLVAQGRSNFDIASTLGCAARTVELHVTRLLEKALADNRATLIARFWTGERE